MRAFEVKLNGREVCVAGVGKNDILNTILNYVGFGGRGERLDGRVGGLFTETDEHATWATFPLKVGDKVQVRVIETDSVDTPKERYRPDSAKAVRNQKAYVRAAAKSLGWKIVERPAKSK